VLALVLRSRLPSGERKTTAITYAAALRSLPALYRSEEVLRVRGALGLLVFAALSVVWSSLVLVMTAHPYSLSHATIGLFGLTSMAGVVSARRAGRLVDLGRGDRVTGAALGVLALAWPLFALIEWTLAAVAIGLLLLDWAVQAVHVTNQSLIYARRPEARSRLAGAYMLFYSAGIAGGALAATATYASAGWIAVCALGGAINVGALALWAATRPRKARQRRRCPAASLEGEPFGIICVKDSFEL
jgi:predicted MFS family arabinose efflux permease